MSSSPSGDRSRVGARDSQTRRALIRATAELMIEEGYAAATSRRVAAKAGVRPALVHYYFPSMDDLFVATLRAGAESTLQRQLQALAGDDPLHTLWRLNSTQGAQLLLEFMALANHRKAIRSEIAAYAERYGEMETAALTQAMRAHGVDMQKFPPVVMSMILTSLARIMLLEQSLGIERGHDAVQEFIGRYLKRFEVSSSPAEESG
ncbi:TetR family transcriptional regulator [Frankia sp. EAN1pec] [Mycobacterium shimoidei]|uniref:TetR family transcriptional regulator [Frankia sp. EAN1pec] n=1 Tax=Mycobacterium shimoidei TaxID=29313 RepID=A0A375Z589_MYCSH|nr:TetR/AcrR family transcriptional regulator [Mycobacterium shimoidei]SRX96256.1 TetR family transcriptional regulator [Frankia sp. EAN1pec] [Mycobacterium shimoidei]